MKTLEQMKRAILQDHSWRRQRRADDTAGYVADQDTARRVRAARTWDQLAERCPPEWQGRVYDRS
jgi:hypothetical protein